MFYYNIELYGFFTIVTVNYRIYILVKNTAFFNRRICKEEGYGLIG